MTLYGVHPRPPGLKRHEPEAVSANGGKGDGDDDAELLLVGKEVARNQYDPVIVAAISTT